MFNEWTVGSPFRAPSLMRVLTPLAVCATLDALLMAASAFLAFSATLALIESAVWVRDVFDA